MPHLAADIPIPQLVCLLGFADDGKEYVSSDEALALIAARRKLAEEAATADAR